MSTKASKKRVVACQEKAQKLVGMITSKKINGHFDLSELTTTLKFAYNIFLEYLKAKGKDRAPFTDDAEGLERSFIQLDEILCKNTDLRFFMRRKVDHLNAQIYKEVAQMYVAQQTKKKASAKKSKKAEGEPEPRFTDMIKDETGRRLWENNFEQSLMIPWTDFLHAFQKEYHVDLNVENQLRYVLDNSNTGFLSIYKFADFLHGFGPFVSCVEKLQSVLSKDYFHGFLSYPEAARLLENKPSFSYLVRFSKSKPGSFAIAYVDAGGNITHTLITCVGSAGFKIEDASGTSYGRGKLFGTLQEVIGCYPSLLKLAVSSDLTRQGWFHGDLTNQEADEVLSGERDGTYLFRFSSKPGHLALSYVQATGIKHGLIECLGNGTFRYENQSPVSSLQQIVNSLADVLKYPLTILTFDSVGKRTDNSNHSSPQSTLSKATSPNSEHYGIVSPRGEKSGSSEGRPTTFVPMLPNLPPPQPAPTSPTLAATSSEATSQPIPLFSDDPAKTSGSGYMAIPSVVGARMSTPVLPINLPPRVEPIPVTKSDGYGVIPLGGSKETNPPSTRVTPRSNMPDEYGPIPETGAPSVPSNIRPGTFPETAYAPLPDSGTPTMASGTVSPPTTSPRRAIQSAEYNFLPAHNSASGTTATPALAKKQSPSIPGAPIYANLPTGSSQPVKEVQSYQNHVSPREIPATSLKSSVGSVPSTNYAVIPAHTNNYGSIPTPIPTPQQANYGSIPVHPKAQSTPTPEANYGAIPAPTVSPRGKVLNVGGTYGVIPVKAPPIATGNYGALPTPQDLNE